MRRPSPKDRRRLYADLAWLWPIVSPPEDYVQESERFAAIVRENTRIDVETLLHLGCGGGHNDHTLKKHFKVTGVDVSEDMLSLARRLNPEVAYVLDDMRTARLGRVFDAVVIFDSLYYMLAEDDLRAAFETAFVHLKPGGVFVTYQEESPERFRQSETRHTTHARGDVEVTLIENKYDPDPRDTTFELTLVCLIRRRGRLQIESDRHRGGIFPTETWLALLNETGFQVKILKEPVAEGCPTLVCTKPSSRHGA